MYSSKYLSTNLGQPSCFLMHEIGGLDNASVEFSSVDEDGVFDEDFESLCLDPL